METETLTFKTVQNNEIVIYMLPTFINIEFNKILRYSPPLLMLLALLYSDMQQQKQNLILQ